MVEQNETGDVGRAMNDRSGALRILTCSALGLALLAGCGSSDDSKSDDGFTPLATMGPQGQPAPTLVGQNVIFVDATLDGFSGGRLLVDTGSPFTLVNGSLFAGAMLPAKTQVTVDIGVGDLTIDRVPALQVTGGTMDQLRLAGILGGNVLRQFSCTFNYRDRELSLGAGALPDGVEDKTSVAFKLSGGGLASLNGSVISVPETRVPITAVIENQSHHFVLDTGASDIVLRSSVFEPLVADGRPTLDDAPFSTVSGSGVATVTRAHSVTFGGQTVTDLPVLEDDTILDAISSELGYQVDGLFGGDFLREFLVTIDFPHGVVELRRYTTRDHIQDEFKRVGMWLNSSGPTGFVVAAVHQGSAAEQKGVVAGDEILAIDGTALSGLDLLASDALLNGSVGATHGIRFGHAQSPALAQSETDFVVEDLIPVD